METLQTPTPKTLDQVFRVSASSPLNPVQTGFNSSAAGEAHQNEFRVSATDFDALKTKLVESEVSFNLIQPKQMTVNGGISCVGESVCASSEVKAAENGSKDGGDSIKEIEVSGENISLVVQVPVYLTEMVDVNKVADMGSAENPTLGSEVKGSRDGENADAPFKETPLSETNTGFQRQDQVREDGQEGDNNNNQDDKTQGQDHGFFVGDFVWSKVKSHPWWPGQIYHPSHASADAAKYQRRADQLFVAYFGDGTFAWCSPSQLKPFLQNFDQFAKQTNSKSFLKAVEGAVEEIGRRIELEMTCSCVQSLDTLDTTPVAVNAGITEGVAVPKSGIGKLFISQFEPVEFVAHLKYIAQVIHLDNMLEFCVLRSRLSAFCRANGCKQLPMYHEPLGIGGIEHNAGNEIVDNGDFEGGVTGNHAEEDWLSSPVGPWLSKTGLTSSQKWSEISEDQLYNKKKQRSMAELMGGDTNLKPEETGRDPVAEEVTGSGRPTSALRKRKEKRDASVGIGGGVAEESTLSKKITSLLKRNNKDSEDGIGSGVAEKLISPGNRTRVLRSRSETKAFEFEDDIDVAEELTVSGNRTRALRKKTETKDSEGGNAGVGAEELTVSGNRTRSRRKRTKNDDSEIGNEGDVDEELTVSGNRTRVLRKREKTNYSEVGDSDMDEDPHSGTRELRIRNNTNYTEVVNDSDDVSDELILSGKQAAESSKRKKNRDSEDENDNGISVEASGGGTRPLLSKRKETSKPSGSHAAASKNISDDAKDGLGTNESTKLGIPLRERKKSKYLSPPYANLSPGLKRSFSWKNSEEEYTGRDAGQVAISPRLIKCSGETVQKELPKEEASCRRSPRKPTEYQEETVIEDGNSSVIEMLAEIRDVAKEPLRVKKRTQDTIRGFFIRLRNSLYHDGADFVIYSNFLAGRKRDLSDNTKLGSPGRGAYEVGHPTTQGESQQKKGERKEGKILTAKKKSKHAVSDCGGKATEETSRAALLLTFAPGASLPSKYELVTKFGQFGAVEESETEVLGDSNCAQVVFRKCSDAQEAYNNLEKVNPFGAVVVSYRLRYLPATAKAMNLAVSEVVPVDDASSILSVRQSLEVTTLVLEKSWDRLSSEVKANLEGDIKGLLDKVTSVVGSSSF